jgi:hypothetical protein
MSGNSEGKKSRRLTELDRQIEYRGTHDRERNIVPRHPRCVLDGEGVTRKLVDSLEIHHSTVVVVLSGEQRLVELLRVNVGQRVVVGIPSAVTRIESSHAGDFVVDETELFVVAPVIDELSGSVLRVSHDDNVVVQVLQGVLGGRIQHTFTAA